MAVWQFTTLTALIGALLLYVSVIARRLGSAEARLTKVEEALLAMRPIESTVDRTAEVALAVADEKVVRGPYLTVRDLKVRSEQLRSQATGPSVRNSGPPQQWLEVLKATRGLKKPPDGTEKEVEPVRISAESHEARSVPSSSSDTSPAPAHSVPTNLQSQDAAVPVNDAPATGNEPQSPSSQRVASADSVARKNRDMALFLSNQRRRRRARLGY